jgi:hypothetical protein
MEKGKITMRVRFTIIVLIAFLVMPAIVFGMASFDYPVVAPVVSFVQGNVTVKEAGAADWVEVEVGRLLASGDTLRTGPSSKAEISCATGKMRLFENTVIVVPEVLDEGDKKDIRKVELEDGTGLFRIKKRGMDKGFEVLTENIIAGVKGTLFGVKYEKPGKKSTVFVYRGVVLVTNMQRTPETATELRRGQALEVTEDGGFRGRKYFDPDNPWYLWEKMDSLDLLLLDKPVRESFRMGDADDDDGNGGLECAPVTDSDGDPIYY